MITVVDNLFGHAIPEPNSGCWLWERAQDACGYGVVRSNGRADRAHRLAFVASGGELLDGEHVCHRCDNPPCINPEHLFAGRPRDNMRDMASKGRAGGQRLSVEQVAKILASHKTQHELAREYGVSQSLIAYHKGRAK